MGYLHLQYNRLVPIHISNPVNRIGEYLVFRRISIQTNANFLGGLRKNHPYFPKFSLINNLALKLARERVQKVCCSHKVLDSGYIPFITP
jgi:hypothetical protein